MNRSERIKSLIDEAGSGYVSVTFIKKDGSERQMTLNPKDVNDIKGTGDTVKLTRTSFVFVITPSKHGVHLMHVV